MSVLLECREEMGYTFVNMRIKNPMNPIGPFEERNKALEKKIGVKSE